MKSAIIIAIPLTAIAVLLVVLLATRSPEDPYYAACLQAVEWKFGGQDVVHDLMVRDCQVESERMDRAQSHLDVVDVWDCRFSLGFSNGDLKVCETRESRSDYCGKEPEAFARAIYRWCRP